MEKKTKNITTNFQVYGMNYYYFMPTENNELKQVRICSYELDSEGVRYFDEEHNLVAFDIDNTLRLFFSLGDYEQHSVADRNVISERHFRESKYNHSIKTAFKHDESGVNISYIGYGYTMVNSECVRKEFDITKIENGTITLPEGFYPNEELCIGFNKVTITKSDGETSTIGGELNDIVLTSEQETARAELEKAFAKCQELKIGFVFDTCEDELLAYNRTEKSLVYDGECRCADFYCVAKMVKSNIGYYSSDDCGSYGLE